MNKWVCSVFLGLFLAAVGCQPGGDNSNKNRDVKRVCVSFDLVRDLAQKVAGDRLEILTMVPSGADVHHWEPTPRDMMRLMESDAFIYNGAGMEHWTGKVLESLEKRNVPALEASKGVTLREMAGDCGHEEEEEHEHEHEHESGSDPHVWLSPRNVRLELENIRDFFQKIDPSNAEYYAENCRKAVEECDRLDAEFRAALGSGGCREVVVTHQAFGYLCAEYGLNQVAVEGTAIYSDPDAARMVSVIEFAKTHGVRTIYVVPGANRQTAETVAKNIGGQVLALNPVACIPAGKDYFSLMRSNLEMLQQRGNP